MSNPAYDSSVFVVIPAYNEQDVITQVIDDILGYHYRVVVVDDGSVDSLLSKISQRNAYFLRHRVNLGQGAALQTGIDFAVSKGAEYIVTFDADGQHDAKNIEQLLIPLEAHQADVVFGSRFMEGSGHNMPSRRKWLLHAARILNFCFTGLWLTDAHNGLRAMNGKAAATIRITENRMAHASEILFQVKKHRLRYVEVPVHIFYSDYSRAKGQSAWSGFRIFFDLLLNKIFG